MAYLSGITLAVTGSAFAGLAVLSLTSVTPPPAAGGPAVPVLVLDTDCGGCPWHDAMARSLRQSYVRRGIETGRHIDPSRSVRVSVEQYDPAGGYLAVIGNYAGMPIHVAAHGEGNAGAAIRTVGARIADALAAP